MVEYKEQGQSLIYALDIGTRSVVGVVGKMVEGRLKVLAIERAEHEKRAMLDGQIDNIGDVAALAREVTDRLESALGVRLQRVCVAAAGRALRTQSGSFLLNLAGEQAITAWDIGQLEAGAVSAAEEVLQNDADMTRQFFLVGYTVAQYRLDNYPLNSLLGHSGRKVEADVVATFLPGEVVDSLYAAMRAAGLQVASLTLEPIAAMNAAVPAELRLLNLALTDIGAGTSDIAVCRDGSIVGYTMVTLAGDEITEAIMRACLVDFQTAEAIKFRLDGDGEIPYVNVLGLEESTTAEKMREVIREPMEHLAESIARQVLEVNGGTPPSALFLAGGGGRLNGLRQEIARRLGMDDRRVAVAGSNFAKSAYSETLDLNDPEYTTPLGIAVSAGLNLLHDSYIVLLNGQPAKLFRSGALTLRDILLMNGYVYEDLLGKTGKNLVVTLDGRRMVFHGEPAAPAILRVNGEESSMMTLVHAGDQIEFVPARPGVSAEKTLGELLGEDFRGRVLVNNEEAELTRPLAQGDVILTLEAPQSPAAAAPETGGEDGAGVTLVPRRPLCVLLNERELLLPGKEDGAPYYLMDLLQHSGIDFQNLDRPVRLLLNGSECSFRSVLQDHDSVVIERE